MAQGKAPQGQPPLQERQENSLEGKRRLENAGDAILDEIPEEAISSAPRGDNEKKFALSEEFNFMLRECSSSDVLQLLKRSEEHTSELQSQ